MQIKSFKDMGTCFDELSIISIKLNVSSILNKDKSAYNYKVLEREIVDGIGIDKFNDILESREYKELYQTNARIFDWIDKLRYEVKIKSEDWKRIGKIGIEIDKLNSARFLAKNNLQMKFFNTEVKEVKIG